VACQFVRIADPLDVNGLRRKRTAKYTFDHAPAVDIERRGQRIVVRHAERVRPGTRAA